MSDNVPPERSMPLQKDVESVRIENKSFVSKAVRETAQLLFPVTTAARNLGRTSNEAFTVAVGDIARYGLNAAAQLGAGEHTELKVLAALLLLPNASYLIKRVGSSLARVKNE